MRTSDAVMSNARKARHIYNFRDCLISDRPLFQTGGTVIELCESGGNVAALD